MLQKARRYDNSFCSSYLADPEKLVFLNLSRRNAVNVITFPRTTWIAENVLDGTYLHPQFGFSCDSWAIPERRGTIAAICESASASFCAVKSGTDLRDSLVFTSNKANQERLPRSRSEVNEKDLHSPSLCHNELQSRSSIAGIPAMLHAIIFKYAHGNANTGGTSGLICIANRTRREMTGSGVGQVQRYAGNTARFARRSDEALGVERSRTSMENLHQYGRIRNRTSSSVCEAHSMAFHEAEEYPGSRTLTLNKRRNSFVCHLLSDSNWCTTLFEGKLNGRSKGGPRRNKGNAWKTCMLPTNLKVKEKKKNKNFSRVSEKCEKAVRRHRRVTHSNKLQIARQLARRATARHAVGVGNTSQAHLPVERTNWYQADEHDKTKPNTFLRGKEMVVPAHSTRHWAGKRHKGKVKKKEENYVDTDEARRGGHFNQVGRPANQFGTGPVNRSIKEQDRQPGRPSKLVDKRRALGKVKLTKSIRKITFSGYFYKNLQRHQHIEGKFKSFLGISLFTLIGSQDVDVKGRPILFTHSATDFKLHDTKANGGGAKYHQHLTDAARRRQHFLAISWSSTAFPDIRLSSTLLATSARVILPGSVLLSQGPHASCRAAMTHDIKYVSVAVIATLPRLCGERVRPSVVRHSLIDWQKLCKCGKSKTQKEKTHSSAKHSALQNTTTLPVLYSVPRRRKKSAPSLQLTNQENSPPFFFTFRNGKDDRGYQLVTSTRRSKVGIEQHRNARAGKMGDPRKNPSIGTIPTRESPGATPAGNRTLFKLVIQRRDDFGEPRENFNRDWADYKNGFGNPAKEFWLGNENIYMLTNNEDYMLRIELEDFEGNKREDGAADECKGGRNGSVCQRQRPPRFPHEEMQSNAIPTLNKGVREVRRRSTAQDCSFNGKISRELPKEYGPSLAPLPTKRAKLCTEGGVVTREVRGDLQRRVATCAPGLERRQFEAIFERMFWTLPLPLSVRFGRAESLFGGLCDFTRRVRKDSEATSGECEVKSADCEHRYMYGERGAGGKNGDALSRRAHGECESEDAAALARLDPAQGGRLLPPLLLGGTAGPRPGSRTKSAAFACSQSAKTRSLRRADSGMPCHQHSSNYTGRVCSFSYCQQLRLLTRVSSFTATAHESLTSGSLEMQDRGLSEVIRYGTSCTGQMNQGRNRKESTVAFVRDPSQHLPGPAAQLAGLADAVRSFTFTGKYRTRWLSSIEARAPPARPWETNKRCAAVATARSQSRPYTKDEAKAKYAQYTHFKIYSEGEYYKLEIDGYEGNAGDSLNDPWYGSNNSPFSTYNSDKIWAALNCAVLRADDEVRYGATPECKRERETGDPRQNPTTSGIVRHDSHLRKSGVNWPGIEHCSPWWEASSLTAQPLLPRLIENYNTSTITSVIFRGKDLPDPSTTYLRARYSAPVPYTIEEVYRLSFSKHLPNKSYGQQ
ncbi:hypothetical protein PR048_021987 [Dryococelus australis]|uniref:Fibrinogen C-terminal domain-containing protein n=1 Tax=Dryococelus australis TaxID=614101 RepID=A0ABQ9GZR5_9NEOP|nr:hypothetical protein PR048_021987 [Dryococelus australis]